MINYQKILSLYTEIKYTTKFASNWCNSIDYTVTILNHTANYKKYHKSGWDIYEGGKLILNNYNVGNNSEYHKQLLELIQKEILLKKLEMLEW